jgi:putative IMPACT (imprinted ancient) family translation regulator
MVERHIMERWLLTFPYISMNDVMKVLRDDSCKQTEHNYSGSDVTLEISFRSSSSGQVTGRLNKIPGLKMKWLATV